MHPRLKATPPPPIKQLLDSTAYPHILDRIIDLAPFAIHLQLRLVSRGAQERVDKLLFTHVAVGTPADSDRRELCEPFPPWNRLPGEDGPQFKIAEGQGQYAEEDRARQCEQWWPWNYVRLVDHYGSKGEEALNFPEATVRYIWVTYGCSESKGLVEYMRIPQYDGTSDAGWTSYTRAESFAVRVLVDVSALDEIDDYKWDWREWGVRHHNNLQLPVTKVAFVFELFDNGAASHDTPPCHTESLDGIIGGLDLECAASLYLGKTVIVAGLECLPLHTIGFPATSTPSEVRDRVRSATRNALRDRALFLAPKGELQQDEIDKILEKMDNFTVCTFEEWAATAEPGEVVKPDIDVDFLGNPAHTETLGAPELPFNPIGHGVGHGMSDYDDDEEYDYDDDEVSVWSDDDEDFADVIAVHGD